MASPCWENAKPPRDFKARWRFERDWTAAFEQRNTLLRAAQAWKAAALEDGWKLDGKVYLEENVSRSCTISRDDMRAMIITRPEPGDFRRLPVGVVTIFVGKKEVDCPLVYDWDAISAAAALLREE